MKAIDHHLLSRFSPFPHLQRYEIFCPNPRTGIYWNILTGLARPVSPPFHICKDTKFFCPKQEVSYTFLYCPILSYIVHPKWCRGSLRRCRFLHHFCSGISPSAPTAFMAASFSYNEILAMICDARMSLQRLPRATLTAAWKTSLPERRRAPPRDARASLCSNCAS